MYPDDGLSPVMNDETKPATDLSNQIVWTIVAVSVLLAFSREVVRES